MNIVVVGAGAQGAPCASILSKQSGVKRILLGTCKESAAAAVRDRLGSDKVVAARLDAREPDAMIQTIRQQLGRADFVLDMTPSFCSQPIMRVALALNAHYLNTAACPEHLDQLIHGRPLDLDEDFRKAGKSAILGMGCSPGAINVICRKFCENFETVERIEIRAGFHVPAQHEMIKTWMPTWSPEQQYFDFCDPPCLFHDGKHEHMPQFYEPEEYDFGGRLGKVQLSHHAHDEQYSLPLKIGKGIRYCCYKYPFEPAVATFFATGFRPDRTVEVNGVKINPVDVLMELLPKPVQLALMDREAQEQIVPLIADTRAHILIKGTVGGKATTIRIETGAYFDQAQKALELFGTANVAVPYSAAAGTIVVAQGNTAAGIVWPEQLDPAKFVEASNSMGLTIDLKVIAEA